MIQRLGISRSGRFGFVNLKNTLLFSFFIPSFLFGSVTFDGTDDYLDCSSDLPLDKSAMTVTAWVNPTVDLEPFPRATIFSHYADAVGVNLEMYLDDGALFGSSIILVCYVLDSGGIAQTSYMDYGDASGWKNVACVWNGSELTPYVDTVEGTPTPISDAPDTNPGTLTMGAQFGPLYLFYGDITDVNYYIRSLSLSEIETLYYSRMRGDVVPTDSRYGHWPLDDLADGTVVNTSTFLNRAVPGSNNCSGSGSGAGGKAYADFIRYR